MCVFCSRKSWEGHPAFNHVTLLTGSPCWLSWALVNKTRPVQDWFCFASKNGVIIDIRQARILHYQKTSSTVCNGIISCWHNLAIMWCRYDTDTTISSWIMLSIWLAVEVFALTNFIGLSWFYYSPVLYILEQVLGEEEPWDVSTLKPSNVNAVVYRLERSKLKYNNLHQKAFQTTLVS